MLRTLVVFLFALMVGGCTSSPEDQWSESSLNRVVKELQDNGIDASSSAINTIGNGKSPLYLRIHFTNKNVLPMPVFRRGMTQEEHNAFTAERNRVHAANEVTLQQSVANDFAVIQRVLRGKAIPLLSVDNGFEHLATLECTYLGLYNVPLLEDFRQLPTLKRLYVHDGNSINGKTVLPQVEDVAINMVSSPAFFNMAAVGHAFPNMRSLTLPDGIPPQDMSVATFPTSLKAFSITNGSTPLTNAYLLASAKKLPGITHMQGIAADKFDPVATFTPEQHTRYNAIPAHLWAEKQFAAAQSAPEQNYGSVPLRGKILVHGQGDFLPQEVPESVSAALRNGLTENAEECDVLVVVASQSVMEKDVKRVGGSGYSDSQAYHHVTILHLFSRNGKRESHIIFYKPPLTQIPEEQEQRNARYQANGIWGEMELLFTKTN